jgi:hypothetical protein
MILRNKLLVMYGVIGTLVLFMMGIWIYAEFRKNQMGIIRTNVNNQLEIFDFSLTSFFHEVENQVTSQNPLIWIRSFQTLSNIYPASLQKEME